MLRCSKGCTTQFFWGKDSRRRRRRRRGGNTITEVPLVKLSAKKYAETQENPPFQKSFMCLCSWGCIWVNDQTTQYVWPRNEAWLNISNISENLIWVNFIGGNIQRLEMSRKRYRITFNKKNFFHAKYQVPSFKNY